MAKKNQTKKIPAQRSTAADFDAYSDKLFWLVIPLFAVIYYLSSKYSVGFYQDDEIGHFVNMKDFWSDPFSILGNWPKPGYKIFMVVPSLFGYQAVLFFNALIASATVYVTYVLIRAYDLRYAFFGALILALQPLFFDLSFRSYAEIFTGLLFMLMLLFYKKEKWILCGLTCGYIFTVRQEIALVGIILGVIFFFRKQYVAIIAIGIFPLLFNFLGYLKTGDILYVITEMNTLGAMDFGGDKRGFFHYFKVYILIVGPVTLYLFILGYFGFISDMNKWKDYLKRFDLPYIVFAITFLIQAMLMVKGLNPGTWRYLLLISPLAAFFATIGLNNLASREFKKTNYILSGILLILTLAFMSKTSNGLEYTDIAEYGKFFVVVIAFVLSVVLFSQDSRSYLNKLSVLLVIISAIYLYISFTPKELSPENLAVKQIAEYIAAPEQSGKKVYMTPQTMGPVVLFGDLSTEAKKDFINLKMENLPNIQKGDLILWDTHYGYRPEYKNDVKFETLQSNPDYKVLNQFVSSDKRFQAFVFEKIN